MSEQLNSIDVNKYDKHMPGWVKGLIGTIASLILIPAGAVVVVMKFGGFEELTHTWAEQTLLAQKPVVESNNDLALQMLSLSNSMREYTKQMDAHTRVLDSRVAVVEDVVTMHGETLQDLEGWAIGHSSSGTVKYVPRNGR